MIPTSPRDERDERDQANTIYLDWNATTPPHPDVIAAVREASTVAWANPASVHGPGRRARAHVEDARESVASLLGVHPRDVVLTGGGTEANNIALLHLFADPALSAPSVSGVPGLLVSRIEHPSVIRAAERLAERGVHVTWVDPGADGVISPEAIADAFERSRPLATIRLVALQAVNHETGVVQPIGRVAEMVHARGALLHVDAVQAAGRLPPDAWAGADLLSIAAHKIRGPKGVGALATRPGIRLRPVIFGGQQERGLRPGTQDPAACAGFAIAAERARAGPARYAELEPLRDRLELELERAGQERGARPLRNGDGPRAPHVSNLSWPGWRGEELCAALDLEGVAVSSGSACSAGTAEPSPVLTAMLGKERASSAVRVSIGEDTSLEDLLEAAQRWSRVLSR